MARTLRGIGGIGNVALGIAQGLRDRRLDEEDKRRWETQQAEGQRRFDASYGLQEEANRRANQQAGMQREQFGQNQKVRRLQLMGESLTYGSKLALSGNLRQAEEVFKNLGMNNLQWDDPSNPTSLVYETKDKNDQPIIDRMPMAALKRAAKIETFSDKDEIELRKYLYGKFAESGRYEGAELDAMVERAARSMMGKAPAAQINPVDLNADPPQSAVRDYGGGLITGAYNFVDRAGQGLNRYYVDLGRSIKQGYGELVGLTDRHLVDPLQKAVTPAYNWFKNDVLEYGQPVPQTQGKGPFPQSPVGQTPQFQQRPLEPDGQARPVFDRLPPQLQVQLEQRKDELIKSGYSEDDAARIAVDEVMR